MNTVHLRAAVNIYTKPEKRLHNFSISIQCCRYKRFFQLFETSSFDGKKNMVKYISTCLFKMNWEWNTGPAHNVVLIVRHTFMLFCFPEIVGSSRYKWKSMSRKLFLNSKFSIDRKCLRSIEKIYQPIIIIRSRKFVTLLTIQFYRRAKCAAFCQTEQEVRCLRCCADEDLS